MRGPGFEPGLTAWEAVVLPLDQPRAPQQTFQFYKFKLSAPRSRGALFHTIESVSSVLYRHLVVLHVSLNVLVAELCLSSR